jgi:GNAT superfamily N-acetyltransferase
LALEDTVILTDTSPRALAHAIEENGAEFLLALGRAGGGEERADSLVHWTIGGSPIDYHNAVVRADLTAESVDTVIGESLEGLRRHNVPGTWHVGPGMRPPDLRERLLLKGFADGGDESGMAVELAALPSSIARPSELTVERVRDALALSLWTDTLGQGFGAGPKEAQWVGDMYGRIGLGDDTTWRHYIGRLDGSPVATASMLLAAGVAGIYFVFTLPEYRRRGIGAAVTLAPLLEARDLGYLAGVLAASTMGEPVYRRMGFREYCRIHIYEWRP